MGAPVYHDGDRSCGADTGVGAVVGRSPGRVAKGLVGQADGVEALGGGGVVGVDVGVRRAGGAPVGAVDLRG